MFEDGIVRKKQIGFDPETSMYCFGGGGGGNNSTSDSAYSNQQTGQGSRTTQPGPNTRTDSRGNTVNFNTTPATVTSTPNYTKTLPNGVVVEDFSRPFAGQVNLSNRGTPEVTDLSTQRSAFASAPVTPTTPMGGLYDNLAINMPNVTVPNVDDLTPQERRLMDSINTPMGNPTTPQEAMEQALGAGQFGDGRVGLGGGFSMGKVPGGFGFQFDRAFAQGGPVTAGIGSLGLQMRPRSTKS
jgi:hypothetical protein